MDNDTITPSEDYLKGFNEGYMLSEHMPETTASFIDKLGDTDRSQGFKDGSTQFTFEKTKAKLPSWLKDDRLTNLNNGSIDKDIEKEKD